MRGFSKVVEKFDESADHFYVTEHRAGDKLRLLYGEVSSIQHVEVGCWTVSAYIAGQNRQVLAKPDGEVTHTREEALALITQHCTTSFYDNGAWTFYDRDTGTFQNMQELLQ